MYAEEVEVQDVLPPLHESVHALLPLTGFERGFCRVFALDAERCPENMGAGKPRFAVAYRLERHDYAALPIKQPIIYTELYRFPEPEHDGRLSALKTHVGEFMEADRLAGTFCANVWQGLHCQLWVALDDVQDVWVVVRFIEGRV